MPHPSYRWSATWPEFWNPQARWLKIADREDGLAATAVNSTPASAGPDLEAENRELRRRAKQLEQENEIRAPGARPGPRPDGAGRR